MTFVAAGSAGPVGLPIWGAKPATAQVAQAGTPAQVRRIQQILTERGYEAGPADGIAGARTVSAIRLYQSRAGIAVDGIPSATLLAALQRPVARPVEPPTTAIAIEPVPAVKEPPPPTNLSAIGRVRVLDRNGAVNVLNLTTGGGVETASYARFWSWREIDGKLELKYDNGLGTVITRSGVRQGNRIVGTAKDSNGGTWTWVGLIE